MILLMKRVEAYYSIAKLTAKLVENHEQWWTPADKMARNERHRAARTRPYEPRKACVI